MSYHFVKKLKDKSGIAVMSVMLYFMVMMIFVGGLTITSRGNMNVSNVSAETAAAYYAAEAGINYVVSDFKRIMDVEEGELTQAQFLSRLIAFVNAEKGKTIVLSNDNGTLRSFTVNCNIVSRNDSAGTFAFTIKSSGTANGVTRTLETLVDLNYSMGAGTNQGFAVKHAVLVKDNFLGNNGVEITANVGQPWVATTSRSTSALTFTKTSDYTGNVEILPIRPLEDLDDWAITNITNDANQPQRVFDTLTLNNFAELDFSDLRTQAEAVVANPRYLHQYNNNLTGFVSGNNIIPSVSNRTFTITNGGDYYVPEMSFTTSEITIHSDVDVFIVTDKLNIQNTLRFTGTGEVKIYVRRDMDSDMDSNGNVIARTPPNFRLFDTRGNNGKSVGRINTSNIINNPHLLVVYVDELYTTVNGVKVAPTITPGNNSYIAGSFMFQNANLSFSNNTSFGGYLMTGGLTVNLSNNAQVFTTLYYAPNAHVTVLNNANVKGAIIANNVTMQQNAKLSYDPAFMTNFPFAVQSPIVDTQTSDGVHSLVFRIHRTTEQ